MKRVCCCSGSSRMIFLAFFFSLLAAVCRSQSAGDAEVMQDLKKSLISDKGIGWDDANPCKWTHLTCSGDRVTMIQIMELNLQGTLPASLSKLTGLQVFEAMRNQLTGPLPRFAPSLQRVQLNENNFTSIPPDFFKGMNSLQTVSLDKNSFNSWVISDDVFKGMNSVQTFSASQANITGPLPDFSKNIQLKNLSLSDNMLTGPVPDSLVGLQSLYMVNLTNNRLQGRRPKFSSSVQIHDMAAGLNRFCLPDPGVNCDPRVNNLLQVSRDLGYPYSLADSWNGNDPCGGSWEGITCNSGGDITVVNFERMSLHGKISPSFSNILSLQRLILSGNYLTGTIPIELTYLPNLLLLDVSNNQLYGNIPSFRSNVILKTDNFISANYGPPPPTTPGNSPGGNGSGNDKEYSSTGVVVGLVVICAFLLAG